MQLPVNSEIEPQEKQLAVAQTYFREIVAPQAAILDQEPKALKKVLQEMGDRALLALRVPRSWGGSEWAETTFCRFQIMIARYSGALAFLQTQHQSAASQLAASLNHPLKQAYLPQMASGKRLVGIAFSQLRRQGEPLLKARRVSGGYQLAGEVPWITGFNLFQEFIIGATLPNGEAVYGIIPFEETRQTSGGTINFSEPMELAAMASTNTVSASVQGWFLECDRVVAVKPAAAIHINDRKNVLHHGFFALGCAQAGLDILETACYKKQLSFLQHSLDSLNQELGNCRQALFEAVASEHKFFEERLELRAWAISLAGRCSHAAVIASSGAANFKSHPAQRVYREALLFSVSGQTTAVMEASLKQLLSTEK